MRPRDIFLSKIRRGKAVRLAVGSATSIVTSDLMEEVGVWFPEAHLDPEKMAVLAAAGYETLGLDNLMPLFSVWHESAALGCDVDWGSKNLMPNCKNSLAGSIEDDISIPPDLLNRQPCAVPLRALELLVKRYGDEAAIVGKVFGPWTLGYHVFGVEQFLMSTLLDPDAVRRAMRELLKVTVAFANAQIDCGVDALTLADHCTRDLCSPDAYRDFLMEIHGELHERIKCPLILHICGDTSDRLPYIAETGIECFHYDSKVSEADARRLAGEKMSLMGGTSNLGLVLNGTEKDVERDVARKIDEGIDILGPECAVPLNAPWRNLKLLAEAAKKQSRLR